MYYSLFGKTFTKGLDKEDKEGGLLKRLKNIENAQKKLDKSEYDEDEDEKKKLSVILIKVVLRV